jgi:hypothetical protein
MGTLRHSEIWEFKLGQNFSPFCIETYTSIFLDYVASDAEDRRTAVSAAFVKVALNQFQEIPTFRKANI